jgi:hypothetical protein
MRFYDTKLNNLVPYARHALAIDETRAEFDLVPWMMLAHPAFPNP